MSKETDKKRKDEEEELEEEQDEEEEEEEEDEEEEGDEEDEEEEEEKGASAKTASKNASADDDEEDDEEDEEEDDEEEEDDAHHGDEEAHQGDEEDPYWWTPHVVLGVLVLVGILGFFGMFNKPLAFLAAKPAGGAAPETTTASAPATPPQPATPPRPMPRPDQMQQAGETFGAKHLLVMYKGGMRAPGNITRTKEEAKARAEEALKKIKDGAKFEAVVGEYSDEPGAGARGGDLGQFRKGQMVPQFQEGVEKIKVGEVSGLVESPFGYHVILRTK